MTIRLALSAECQAIADLHAASWRFAYRGALSEEYLASDIMADRRMCRSEGRFENSCFLYRLPLELAIAGVDGIFFGDACSRVLGKIQKIDRSVLIVAETEEISNRRNSALKSIAKISDGLRSRYFAVCQKDFCF